MLDLTRCLERLIATPSVSSLGNGDVAREACALLDAAGVCGRIETARIDGVTHHAVIADLGPPAADGDPGLLLLTHLDTVPPGDPADWTATGGDPWRPARDGNRLYGLGSADVKGDFVCKVAALEGLDPARLRRPLRLVGSFAEEIGLLGARWLVETGGTRGMRRALVGEPSELVAIHAHKGYAKYEALVRCPPAHPGARARVCSEQLRGRSAHSSTPHLGQNAIEAALERLLAADAVGWIELEGGTAVNKVPDACTLRWLEADPRSEAPPEAADALDAKPLAAFLDAWRAWQAGLERVRDAQFDPAHVVSNLGGAARVPGGMRLSFDVRTVPGSSAEALVEPLHAVAELRCLRTNPALGGDPDGVLLRTLADAQRACGLEARSGTKATCTEAGLLAQAGLEAIVFGAGVSVGNVHRPDEYTLVDQLPLARDVYRHVIERLCCDAGTV